MPLEPALPIERVPADAPRPADLPLPIAVPGERPRPSDSCRAPAELGGLDDHQLYALEADRCLDPDEWHRVEAELRRRRQSRRVSSADVGLGVPVPPPATLSDLERVSQELEQRLAAQLGVLDHRARALRWWTMVAPLAWGLVGLAAWGLSVHDGAGWTALAAALVD
jgi:hypothetical protein